MHFPVYFIQCALSFFDNLLVHSKTFLSSFNIYVSFLDKDKSLLGHHLSPHHESKFFANASISCPQAINPKKLRKGQFLS